MPRIRLVRVAEASAPEDFNICDIAPGGYGFKFQVPSSKFQVPSSKFQVPSSKFQVPSSQTRIAPIDTDSAVRRTGAPFNYGFVLIRVIRVWIPRVRLR